VQTPPAEHGATILSHMLAAMILFTESTTQAILARPVVVPAKFVIVAKRAVMMLRWDLHVTMLQPTHAHLAAKALFCVGSRSTALISRVG